MESEALAPESESAQLALKEELIAETLGDVVKLRREVAALETVLAQAIDRHAEIGQNMINQQREQFAAMAASEVEKIKAQHTVDSEKALAGAHRSLTRAAELLESRPAQTILWPVIGSGSLGFVVGCVVIILVR